MLLVLSMMFLGGASSCSSRGIKWNPDLHKADSNSQSLVNERSEQVFCYEEKFDEFACLHKDKIKELADILTRARLPKDDKVIIDRIFKDINKVMEKHND